MTHPGIVVDEERRSADHPRRVPLVLGRTLSFTEAGLSMLPGKARATLDVVEGAGVGDARLSTKKGIEPLVRGDKFHVNRHPYRLEAGDDVLVDPRHIGTAIAFNCWHAGDSDVRWRGFAVDDVKRTPIDVLVTKKGLRYAPSTAGMPLTAVVDATTSQRAAMEPPVAAVLARALLLAASTSRLAIAADVVATWDGAAVVVSRSALKPLVEPQLVDPRAHAVTTFHQLCGRDAVDVTYDHVRELHDFAPNASAPDAVAAVVRALFPDAWAIEEAVREQAAMLDVTSIA